MAVLEEEALSQAIGGTLTMRMEYDNCKENVGATLDHMEFELNSFGKPPMLKSSELKRARINNTKHDASVTFKLCVGGSENKKQHTLEAAVLAEAKFHLAEVQTIPNQQLNFFLPLKVFDSSANESLAMMFASR